MICNTTMNYKGAVQGGRGRRGGTADGAAQESGGARQGARAAQW